MNEPNSKDLKTFSFIWTFIFIIISVVLLYKGYDTYLWMALIALLFLLIGIIRPFSLKLFYIYWTRFGEIIGGIMSKIILFILFYGMFTPIALVLRLLGKDLLNKCIDKTTDTYWIKRETQPGSLKNQF